MRKVLTGILNVALVVALRLPLHGAEPVGAPRTFCLDGPSLQEIRRQVLANDPSVNDLVAMVRRNADRAMQTPLQTVTDKTYTAPSGSKHDYISLSKYFWPNPATTDGLPYLLRDGETNPETSKYDSDRMGRMCRVIQALTLAYYLTGQEAYAERAARQLRRWFLDPATRMNPNLKYAQMVKGKNEGSRWGIIDTWPLIQVVDGVGLIAGSKAWTPNDTRAMQDWFADYLTWLRASEPGRAEAKANNNHGVYYDIQVSDFALFTGQTNLAREVLEQVKTRRIETQIEPDGSMPAELARTKSLSYSLFNLAGFFTLARLGQSAQVDLWDYRTTDGRSLRAALDWMTPFALGQKRWTHRQISKQSFAPMVSLLHQASIAWQAPVYEGMVSRVKSGGQRVLLNQLLQSLENVALQVAVWDRSRILKLADDALMLKPLAITDEVATNSPGGPHDYFSQADYAWPNPTNRDGLPFVLRDGESNPNTFTGHRLALRRMKDAVASLAAAYAITGEDKYAAKAAQLLRVFFLDPATRMNPNLQYAQAISGVSTGTPYGIIDTLHLAEVAMALRFLEKCPDFPASVDRGMKRWFADYTQWIMTSAHGVAEMNSANNHSIACFVQLASFAKFTGDEAVLNFARQRFEEVLFPKQMAADGSFPRELARTKPYAYSIFQADNLATLCVLLSTTSEDLWKLTLPDGRTPRRAVDFIFPYLADKARWLADGHRQDVLHWESWPARQSCLIFAYAEFGDKRYLDLWRKLDADPADPEVRRNLAITQPLLWLASP